jgi:predicted NAD-dependent protein-ADP-ribosyltransferase YbiA (DUF1768 family)
LGVTTDTYVTFTKTREEWGWMGNMSAHPVRYDCQHGDVVWRTAEHLFQALRLPPGHPAVGEILLAASPMQAKFAARAAKNDFLYPMRSPADLNQMRRVIRAKAKQHNNA